MAALVDVPRRAYRQLVLRCNVALLFSDLLERLKDYDVLNLVELLKLTPEQIVEKFEDEIFDDRDRIGEELIGPEAEEDQDN